MRLGTDDARARFAAARVARLATVSAVAGTHTDQGTGAGGVEPHLVPVTFAVEDDLIVTAVDAKPKTSTNLKRLRNIREHPQVSLLADRYVEDWSDIWWVRADGAARVLEAEADRAGAVRLLREKYEQYAGTAPEGPVIAVTVRRWVGWSASR